MSAGFRQGETLINQSGLIPIAFRRSDKQFIFPHPPARRVEPRSQRPATAGVSRKRASHTGLRWHLDLDWKRSICLLLPMVGSLSDVREYLRPSKEFQSLTKRRRRLGICWILRCAGPCFACPNGGRQGLIHCPPLMLLESVRADSDFETLRF